MAESFWSESWKTVDPKRIAEYVSSMDLAPDDMIDVLRQYRVKTVCDAGCGCGAYFCKLLRSGFLVSGFDVSEDAVRIAEHAAPGAKLKQGDIRETGYASGIFDAVVARDVLDHMTKEHAALALAELCRIVKPGGVVVFTLDFSDAEYESEPHEKNADGDLLYTSGKWTGMVFHSYSCEEIRQILPEPAESRIEKKEDYFLITLINR